MSYKGPTNCKQVSALVSPPPVTGMCHIQIIEEPEPENVEEDETVISLVESAPR